MQAFSTITFLSVVKAIVEISLIWFALYRFVQFIQGTRIVPALRALIALSVLFAFTTLFDLRVINWILTKLFALSVIAFLVVFQPEIRRLLGQIGQTYVFDMLSPLPEDGAVNKVTQSLLAMAQKRIGALVAFERGVGLKQYADTGVRMEAAVSPEVIGSIFAPLGPLHDGGIIIAGGRIVAAGCIFPLTQQEDIDRGFGTRHRAALGLSEETDAVVVVVSEETGTLSIARGGELIRDFEGKDISFVLKDLLQQPHRHKRQFAPWRRKRA